MNINTNRAMPTIDENAPLDFDEHNQNPLPPPPIESRSEENKSTRSRRNRAKKEERPNFSIALSSKEIEHDFIAITGKKPRRKPKRESKSIEMKLNTVFPGSWLHEVNPDRYKVKEH
ncbi:hypothetical protein QVD17_33015 [Tagetes erecta]|uniref:Uncharacterized protein n=1 Tax=Tagetes erecta TaxID=13708 RepID=A0AAD8JWB7_TARER|nr:hypothetical protein QVD17_33015 [Tagetes erecta]